MHSVSEGGRITTLGADGKPQGADRVIDSTVLGGFTVTPTGYGLTAVQDPKLSVVGLPAAAGPETFRTLLIGDKAKNIKGAKFDPMDFGSSRLAYAGGKFCAYYAHQQQYSDTSDDVHQPPPPSAIATPRASPSSAWAPGTSRP